MVFVPAFTDEGERRFFIGYKTAVANERLSQIARQKAREGEDPLETGMNKGESEKLGSRPILVLLWGQKNSPPKPWTCGEQHKFLKIEA